MPPIRQNNFSFTKDKKIIEEVASPFRTLGIIFLILSISLSGGVYWGMTYLQDINLGIESDIKSIESSLASVPLEEMLSFYGKIRSVNTILSAHSYVTTQLNTLSDAVEPLTHFKTFNFVSREKGKDDLSLSAITADKANMVRQIDILRSDKYKNFIKSVELKSVSKDILDNVSFDLKLSVDATVKPDYMVLSSNIKDNKITPAPNSVQSSIIINQNSATTTTSSTSANKTPKAVGPL